MKEIYTGKQRLNSLSRKISRIKFEFERDEDQRDRELAESVPFERIRKTACDGCLDKAEQNFLAADLKKAAEKARLSPRQEMILEKIYFDNKEQAVIAEEMGVTRSRVWEIKERALRKMRTLQASRILKGWL